MDQYDLDVWHMQRALDLAVQGQGLVEPNPMVGCVIVQGAEIIGEGWHRQFGGPHAEVEALKLAGRRAEGATMYVTLEPCCHQGKTPPCTKAILEAKIARVVVAQRDPFPEVDGGGIRELQEAGVAVETGLLEPAARGLNAPYLTLQHLKRPWIIAKWAMTLDGKTATKTGFSKWISNAQSREIVHRLRGRVDAVMIGRLTARLDDPLLTARPPGPRTAVRVVVDTRATLSNNSRLVRTAWEVPVLVAVGTEAPAEDRRRLKEAGCEVFVCKADTRLGRLNQLLEELGRRRMTNVLVEGGGQLAGCLLDSGQIDEAHVFIAPKLIGGISARNPIAGEGIEDMPQAFTFLDPQIQQVGSDIYFHGRLERA
ncbi:MAG: bifunctional diaminohydroxyphosphoribosylaminopyrimidine deaminase/5-amino-6-(5-phosphoribosylamino)uracil reductase RibD [Planctomycetaceae bacterium]|nr:bifunctional diaminohydroxyphosphoribosylaminopyrimidine deaminase/5-amino-6-(5-phosphoribosylamino)uracil reductase RibD [Planctomycetaceae bacterium]